MNKSFYWSSLLGFIFFIILIFTPLGTFIKSNLIRFFASAPERASKKELVTEYTGYFFDSEGNKFNFSSFENEVVIINFWATWCPPCLAEKPSFQKLYDDYKDKIKFAFISQETPIEIKVFLDKHHYTFPIFYEAKNLPSILDINSIPTTFVLDKKGNIIIKQIGAADWNNEKTRELLNTLIKN